jgi:hypothetical protein
MLIVRIIEQQTSRRHQKNRKLKLKKVRTKATKSQQVNRRFESPLLEQNQIDE